MKVIPCMYHQNGNNLLYAICHPMNAEATVKKMNERLKSGENKYNGLDLNGIDYFLLVKPMTRISTYMIKRGAKHHEH